jgi:hypothetical protein
VRCFWGYFPSVNRDGGTLHAEGHKVGDELKVVEPAYFSSIALKCSRLSDLARVNLDCGFAEGYVVSQLNPFDSIGQLLKLTVSQFLADPALVGAPDHTGEDAKGGDSD